MTCHEACVGAFERVNKRLERLERAVPGADAEGWRDIASAPEVGGTWVWLYPQQRAARLGYDGRWWSSQDKRVLGEPTHWMPLPAPPEAKPTAPQEKPE